LRNIQHIGKKDEEATKLRSQKRRQKMELDRDQITHQHAYARRQKKKKKGASQKLKPNTTFCKRGYIYKSISVLTKVLGLHATKEFCYIRIKLKITREAKSTPPRPHDPQQK
jgi:hypothetical protein